MIFNKFGQVVNNRSDHRSVPNCFRFVLNCASSDRAQLQLSLTQWRYAPTGRLHEVVTLAKRPILPVVASARLMVAPAPAACIRLPVEDMRGATFIRATVGVEPLIDSSISRCDQRILSFVDR